MGSIPSGISGSRGAGALGENPFKTRLGVWMDIIEDIEPGWLKKNGFTYEPFTGNASTRWGNAFENAIIKLAESAQGVKIGDLEKQHAHKQYDFITCHIDGRYNFTSENILHEGKTTSSFTFRDKWGEPGSDLIPREYFIQVQHQMMLTGATSCYVSVLVFPERPDILEKNGVLLDTMNTDFIATALDQLGFFHQYHIESNPELQKAMLHHYKEFWFHNVEKRITPEAMNFDDIRRLAIEPKETVIADEDIERLAVEYKDINAELSRAKKRKDQIKTRVVKYMSENQQGNIDEDSTEKLILRNSEGKKLAQYDGRAYR